MRRLVLIGGLVALLLAGAAPARADLLDQYLVVTDIAVDIIDPEWGEDRHCSYRGGTRQYITPSMGVVNIGGTPGADFPGDAGPFRFANGTAIRFTCGVEHIACFRPVTGSVSEDGRLATTISVYAAPKKLGDCTRIGIKIASFGVDLGTRQCARGIYEWTGIMRLNAHYCAAVSREGQPEPLALVNLACESFLGRFECEAVTRGGTAPLTYRWAVNGVPRSSFDDLRLVSGPCTVGRSVSIRVTVGDAVGASQQASLNLPCRNQPL